MNTTPDPAATVQRYMPTIMSPETINVPMIPYDKGEWVSYSDYLAKLTVTEKERDENQAAQRSIIMELQQAMADVFRHLGPPTDRYTPWREQVIAAIDTLTTDLAAALTRTERAEKLLGEAGDRLILCYHRCAEFENGKRCNHDMCASCRGKDAATAEVDTNAALYEQIEAHLAASRGRG